MAGSGTNPFRNKNRPPSGLTRAGIEADLQRFQSSGGRIEKLGNTPALRRAGEPAPANPFDGKGGRR